MPTITRKLEFDSGHRVLGHEGKCRYLHGHRYVAEVTVHAPGLDELGRVVDFGVIKEVVGGWINDNWDHNMILHPDDPLATVWSGKKTILGTQLFEGQIAELFGGKQPYIMPSDKNPTAENLAKELFLQAADLLSFENVEKSSSAQIYTGLKVIGIRLWETPNSFADYPDKIR